MVVFVVWFRMVMCVHVPGALGDPIVKENCYPVKPNPASMGFVLKTKLEWMGINVSAIYGG